MTTKLVGFALIILFAIAGHSEFTAAQSYPEKPIIKRLRCGNISGGQFSPDGKLIAAGAAFGVWLFKVNSLEEWKFLEELTFLGGHAGKVTSIAFSPDGKLLASSSWADDSIQLWEVSTGVKKTGLQGHAKSVESVAFSPDGKLLASGSWDGTIALWELKLFLHSPPADGAE